MMSGPILLDTCSALFIMNNEWMRPEAVSAIDRASDRNEKIFVSPITAWEVGKLAEKGRFKSNYSPQRWLALLLARPGIAVAGMPPHVLLESSHLPGEMNGDPADRIIAATAREFGFTVMTRDKALLDYGKKGYMSVLQS